ncbi:MAG: tetratricopeptide repeat protein [Spirochaetes bacterium]|nr:tetratricopeptide repeat protein [Spirochaetota bacterium]MBU0954741.1 tetratricopeptide repeat protein [Spirochaetota bacterium]
MRLTFHVLARLLACLLAVLVVACSTAPDPADTTSPVDPALIVPAAITVPEKVPTPEELFRLEMETIAQLAVQNQLSQVDTRLSALLENYPEKHELLLLLSSIKISLSELDAAEALVQQYLEQYPDSLQAMMMQAELQRFAGNLAGRTESLEKIISIDANNTDALSALGDISYDAKNYQRAELYFRRSLAVQPDHIEALMGLAQVQYRRQDYRSALVNLNTAVEAAPQNPMVYLDRSRVLYQLGKYQECETDLSVSIDLLPSAWAYLERGRLYLDTGRLEAAELDFSGAIELSPDFFLPYVYRAGMYEETGQDEKAYADYQKVTEINTEYWYVWEAMGTLAVRLERWTDAARAFDKAAGFTNAHREYLVAAGLSLMMAGQQREARDYARANITKIDRSTHPMQWLLLRQVMDQNISSGDLEQQISKEKSLDSRSAGLFYLGLYWLAKEQPALGAKYIQLSLEADRQGTIEWRMAEAMLKRLATVN